MEQSQLAALLDGLTRRLGPGRGSSDRDLRRLKSELQDILPTQRIEEITHSGLTLLDQLDSTPELRDPAAPEGPIDPRLIPLPRIQPGPAMRVFRREIPAVTTQYAASAPQWAAGQHIDHTLGPFVDHAGKTYWFDFYRSAPYARVVRGSQVILLLPLQGINTAQAHYDLPPGSVWIQSRLLTPTAPPGAYTGLRIRSGQISFPAPISISSGSIVIGSGDPCDLQLRLDQPSVQPAADTTTGDDAERMTTRLPREVRIEVKPAAATIVHTDEMSVHVYGRSYRFRINGQAPAYEPALNRIVVPYEGSESSVSAPEIASNLFRISGEGPVLANAWALPVTVAHVDQLGEAAGVGAIAIKTRGLRASWEGLRSGPVRLGDSYLMTEPGRISLSAACIGGKRSVQQFELWQERNPTKEVRSVAEVRYSAAFRILYECASSGSETIVASGVPLRLHIDRPMTAARQRLRVDVPESWAVLFEIQGERWVYLHAERILQQLLASGRPDEVKPITVALTNAFLEVTPVDSLDLIGEWSDPGRVDRGALVLFSRLHYLLPTLPDPYVSSFNPLSDRRFGMRGEQRAANLREAGGVYLGALVGWKTPQTPELLFAFVQANQADTTGLLPPATEPQTQPLQRGQAFGPAGVHNRSAEVLEEDQLRTNALRQEFERALDPIRDRASRNAHSGHLYLLDVSTTADLFGVGLRLFRQERETATPFSFAVSGLDLVTVATLTRVYTLPQIQWEPIRTIQNRNVKPHPFPSPATSPDTGDPTLLATESYSLVPIAPKPVIDEMVKSYNGGAQTKRMAALFSLPFGMKAAATFSGQYDPTIRGARVRLNSPDFPDENVKGGIQISVVATSPFAGPKDESPGFPGATIQTRNLIDLLTGNIPLDDEGKPLSVLGPVVDTVFNNEFRPGGAKARVPVRRIDFSGYGATLFSEWLNPSAQIAATSQARFDVLIGRTAHEIIQIKSLLYPWAVPVVRTITIQRTSGGGVTRYDSGWKAQGAGEYDFSYYEYDEGTGTTTFKANPYEVHPGVVRGVYNVTEIRDTGRIYRQPHADPLKNVEMQEVFFDCDVSLEDLRVGAINGLVPSKRQRGFVQLAPYQKPLTPDQFRKLLKDEGSLGGNVLCVISVGNSGQLMDVVLVDVHPVDGPVGAVFAAVAHGGLHLPSAGSWSVVRRGQGAAAAVSAVNQESGVLLIREGKLGVATSKPYRFADPSDLFNESNPVTDCGLLHATSSERTLYLRPTIARDGNSITSTLRPYFADSYALLNTLGLFPELNTVFQLGPGGTSFQILGDGQLRLDTLATLSVPPGFTRDLMNTGGSRIYVDYAERPGGSTSQVGITFDSSAPVPWTAAVKRHSLVMSLAGFDRMISIAVDHESHFGGKPNLKDPKVTFGPPLEPIVDFLRFIGGFDMAQAFRVNMGNSQDAKSSSWQPKWKAGVKGLVIEFRAGVFPVLKISAFGIKLVQPSEQLEFEANLTTPLPPVKVKLELGVGLYNNDPFKGSEERALEKAGPLSAGGFFKFEGQLSVLCFALSQNTGVYFFGILGFEIEVDSKEGKTVTYKVAMGLELVTKWPIVGEVALQSGIGVEYENSTKGHAFFVLGFFKGEAELLEGLVVIVISVEAKGGQQTELEDGVQKCFAVMAVEFAAEVSVAFIINIEFSVTWEEKKQLS